MRLAEASRTNVEFGWRRGHDPNEPVTSNAEEARFWLFVAKFTKLNTSGGAPLQDRSYLRFKAHED
jgi:hypothetical protein